MQLDSPMLRYYAARFHAADWLVLLPLVIIVAVIYKTKQPYCRPFLWTDATIGYPWKEDTFPNYSLVLMIIFGLLFILLWVRYAMEAVLPCLPPPLTGCGLLPRFYSSFFAHQRREAGGAAAAAAATTSANARRGQEAEEVDADEDDAAAQEDEKEKGSDQRVVRRGPVYQWVRMYLWGVALTCLLVPLLETYTGRLRPDYLARLAKVNYTPATYHLNSNYQNNQTIPDPMLEPQFYCDLMKTNHELKVGRLSFPSGHSSISFSVATLLHFFLAAHLRPYACQGSFTRLLVCLLPFSFALICATSRTRDNKHHYTDVVLGALIGIWSGWMAFHMAFRSAGGAAELYLARGDRDVELHVLQQQLQQQVAQYELLIQQLQSNDSIHRNTDDDNNNNNTHNMNSEDRRGGRGDGGEYSTNHTANNNNNNSTNSRSRSETATEIVIVDDEGSAPPSTTATPTNADNANRTRTQNAHVGGLRGRRLFNIERKLNEDNSAVQWI